VKERGEGEICSLRISRSARGDDAPRVEGEPKSASLGCTNGRGWPLEDASGKGGCRFIEETQPDICISGHIHESAGEDTIGVTRVFNAGPFKGGGYIVARIEGKSVSARLEFL